MNIRLFFLILLILPRENFAQHFQWVDKLVYDETTMPVKLFFDKDSNMIAAGNFGASIFNRDRASQGFFITKYTGDRSVSWIDTIHCTRQVEDVGAWVDLSGNTIMGGRFEGDLEFGGKKFINKNVSDGIIFKVDPNGKHLWAYQLNANYSGAFTSIITDQDNFIYAGGQILNNGNYDGKPLTCSQAFICKLNEMGQMIWFQELISIPFVHKGTFVFGRGNALYFLGDGDLEPSITKIDKQTGKVIWSKMVSSTMRSGEDLKIDRFGNLYLSGNKYTDCYIWKMDSMGNVINQIYFTGDQFNYVSAYSMDIQGDSLFVTGGAGQNINFAGISGGSNSGLYLAGMDLDLNIKWVKGTKVYYAYTMAGRQILKRKDKFYIFGQQEGGCYFDSIYVDGYPMGTYGDAYITCFGNFNLVNNISLNSNVDGIHLCNTKSKLIPYTARGNFKRDNHFTLLIKDSLNNIDTLADHISMISGSLYLHTKKFSPGKYFIHLTSSNPQLEESSWHPVIIDSCNSIITSVSSNKHKTKETLVFPNPGNGHYKLVSKEEILKLEVSDLSGRIVYTRDKIKEKETEVDFVQTGGIYFLKVYYNSGMETIKLVYNE